MTDNNKYIIKVDNTISDKEAEHIIERWKRFLIDPNNNVVVLGKGATVQTIQGQAVAPYAPYVAHVGNWRWDA